MNLVAMGIVALNIAVAVASMRKRSENISVLRQILLLHRIRGRFYGRFPSKVLLLLLSSDASTSMMRCSATSLRRGANTRRYGPDLPDVWWKFVPSKEMWSIKAM